jgi:hypothetical protein
MIRSARITGPCLGRNGRNTGQSPKSFEVSNSVGPALPAWLALVSLPGYPKGRNDQPLKFPNLMETHDG